MVTTGLAKYKLIWNWWLLTLINLLFGTEYALFFVYSSLGLNVVYNWLLLWPPFSLHYPCQTCFCTFGKLSWFLVVIAKYTIRNNWSLELLESNLPSIKYKNSVILFILLIGHVTHGCCHCTGDLVVAIEWMGKFHFYSMYLVSKL